MRNSAQFLRDHFNDADGVVNLLNLHAGRAPQRAAVIKWFERNSIPGDWWPALIHAVDAEAGRVSVVTPYVIETQEPENDIFD